jgi:GT2 family glycosyltransferase
MMDQFWISVIILNYNGAAWMFRCLQSIAAQTIFNRLQIIIADNASSDGSDHLSQQLIAGWSNAVFVQNSTNCGFGAGSNLAVRHASGRYLYFLNPDVWLEPDCLEQLYDRCESAKADASGLLILEYDDNNTVQSAGSVGFDFCGYLVHTRANTLPHRPFSAAGFFFIRTDLFRQLGGYDDHFFLYGEELDLSWRVWIAGGTIVNAPGARMHHRGAAAENPKGGTKIVEMRTSDSKRFYANRNHLLTLLKNVQHFLLLLLFPATALIVAEGLAGAILLCRWSFFSRTCLQALTGCWKLRAHIRAERKRVRSFRKHGDFWMLRFFSLRLGRWGDYRAILKQGLPRVDRR